MRCAPGGGAGLARHGFRQHRRDHFSMYPRFAKIRNAWSSKPVSKNLPLYRIQRAASSRNRRVRRRERRSASSASAPLPDRQECGRSHARSKVECFRRATFGCDHAIAPLPASSDLTSSSSAFALVPSAGDVVLIFEQYTERVRHGRRIERDDVKFGERARPIERFSHAG